MINQIEPATLNRIAVVRLLLPLRILGLVAMTGVQSRNGVELAVEKINASGGINGRPIELVIRDDKCTAEPTGHCSGTEGGIT